MASAADVELGSIAAAPAASLLAVEAEGRHGESSSLLLQEGAEMESPPRVSAWRGPARLGAAVLAALGLAGLGTAVFAGGAELPLRFRPERGALEEKQLLSTFAGAASPTCQTGPLPKLWSPSSAEAPMQVRVLSYNLFWWNLFDKVKPPQMQFHLRTPGNTGTQLLASAAQREQYDVMGFQECNDEHWLLSKAGLAGSYSIFRDKHCCMAYRTSSWSLLGRGVEWVALDKQYGPRPAQWMRLRHVATNRVLFFVNHHGPIPINSGGVCGGAAVAYHILQLIATRAQPGDAVVLAGDFNSDATSVTIQHLEARLHKAFGGVVDGGIDYIFSNLGEGSLVSAHNLGNGGSDHDAISAVLRVSGEAAALASGEPGAVGASVGASMETEGPPAMMPEAAGAGGPEFPTMPAGELPAAAPQQDGSVASRLRFLLRTPLRWLRK